MWTKREKLAWFWFSVRMQTVKTWTVAFERPGKITGKMWKNGSPWQSYIACIPLGLSENRVPTHSICTYGSLRPSCGLPFFSAARNHHFSHIMLLASHAIPMISPCCPILWVSNAPWGCAALSQSCESFFAMRSISCSPTPESQWSPCDPGLLRLPGFPGSSWICDEFPKD